MFLNKMLLKKCAARTKVLSATRMMLCAKVFFSLAPPMGSGVGPRVQIFFPRIILGLPRNIHAQQRLLDQPS
jgi:hypothetical protein